MRKIERITSPKSSSGGHKDDRDRQEVHDCCIESAQVEKVDSDEEYVAMSSLKMEV